MPAGRPKKVTDKQIEEALIQCDGFTSFAAGQLSISRRGLEKRIEKSKKLQDLVDELRENQILEAESVLMKLIRKEIPSAVYFFLKTRAGYSEKQQIEHSGNIEAPVNISIVGKKS